MASSIPSSVAYILQTTAPQAFATTGYTVAVEFMNALPKDIPPYMFRITEWTGAQEWAELGPLYRREETGEIHCEITAYAGSQSLQASIDRQNDCAALHEAFTLKLYNDMTLGGNLRLAELSDYTLECAPTNIGGTLATLTFSILTQQRITTLS